MYISFYASEIHKLDRLIQTAYTFISTQIKCRRFALVWKITHVDCLLTHFIFLFYCWFFVMGYLQIYLPTTTNILQITISPVSADNCSVSGKPKIIFFLISCNSVDLFRKFSELRSRQNFWCITFFGPGQGLKLDSFWNLCLK